MSKKLRKNYTFLRDILIYYPSTALKKQLAKLLAPLQHVVGTRNIGTHRRKTETKWSSEQIEKMQCGIEKLLLKRYTAG